jgi:hypothetical protein
METVNMDSLESAGIVPYTGKAHNRGVPMGGPGKGKKGLYVDLPIPVLERLRQFADERGERLAAVVEQAVVRHMASPPPLPGDVPLPPVRPKKKGK